MNSNNKMDSVRKWVNGWWKGSRARNSDGGGRLSKGFQGSEGEGNERREKEEEERRGNEVEALPNHNCDHPLHRSLFCVLRATVG